MNQHQQGGSFKYWTIMQPILLIHTHVSDGQTCIRVIKVEAIIFNNLHFTVWDKGNQDAYHSFNDLVGSNIDERGYLLLVYNLFAYDHPNKRTWSKYVWPMKSNNGCGSLH